MAESDFYRLIDHTADLGILVNGTSLEKLFENAGKALLEQIVRIKMSSKKTKLSISLSGTDLEDLMVNWLSEILYLFNGDNMIAEDISVKSIRRNHIKSTLNAVPFNRDKHTLIREVKAVTYHQIEVKKNNDLWIARVIFDV